MGDGDSIEYIKVQTLGGKDFYVAGPSKSSEPILRMEDLTRDEANLAAVVAASAAQTYDECNAISSAAAAALANSKYISSQITSSTHISSGHIGAHVDGVLPVSVDYIKMQEDLVATREIQENSAVIIEMMADEIRQLRDEIKKLNDTVYPKIDIRASSRLRPPHSVFKSSLIDEDDYSTYTQDEAEADNVLTNKKVLAALERQRARTCPAAPPAASAGTVSYDLEAMTEAVFGHDESHPAADDTTLSSWAKFFKKQRTHDNWGDDDWGYE